MGERTLNLKGLAAVVGLARSTLCEYAKREGFPCDRTAAGPLFDKAEVLAYMEQNGLGKRSKSVQTPAPKVAQALVAGDDAHVEILRSGSATPQQSADAVLHMLNMQFANVATSSPLLSKPMIDSIVSAIERATIERQRARIEDERRGELIERAAVIEVVGGITTRLIQVGESFCSQSQQQFEIWLGDTEFTALTISERNRKIKAWMKAQFDSIRRAEADEVERMVKEAAANKEDGQ